MKKIRFLSSANLLLVIALSIGCEHQAPKSIAIIPQPQTLELSRGIFSFDATTPVYLDNIIEQKNFLQQELANLFGWSPQFSSWSLEMDNNSSGIYFKKSASLPTEGYTLDIKKQSLHIQAADWAGFSNALSSLKQLILLSSPSNSDALDKQASLNLPLCSIIDEPAFSWRGLMLDCSRTFIPLANLKQYVDLLSFYKMNVLHLHLTDDQGWRLEIKKFPELTARCSESAPVYSDQKGGYYTQEEMAALITYASYRNVTIVPEIEMPGHSSEVFAAYPELSCTGNRTEIFPFFAGPGITQDILCAGKELVFDFMERVLDEVCDLFPSPIIHIGGDEAPKTRWHECPDCQKRIQDEGLADEHELQSYFIQRIEKMLQAREKILMGWDEILEGGLAENAAVMSWRGMAGGIAAAKAHHPVVMSPTSHCYFDYTHMTTSVEEVYDFNPIPSELSTEEASFILGGQGNFWSHIDRDHRSMQRQIFPRLIALSEVLWSDQKDSTSFQKKLASHYPLLDSMGISYYRPNLLAQPLDSTDIISRLNLEAYYFDFHGYQGLNFNYRGMQCKVVQPKAAAPDHPWIWRARFWGHEPQLDVALLAQGYHVVYCEVGNLFGNPEAVRRWNTFYSLLQKGGLAKKAVLEGMSRGGLIIYNWALENPDKVACIYADAPVLSGFSWPGGFGQGKGSANEWARFKRAYRMETAADSLHFTGDPMGSAHLIAKLGIPLIHVCGVADQVVPISENTDAFASIITQNGGYIKLIRKEGVDHHPHSLEDPSEILNFILEHQ